MMAKAVDYLKLATAFEREADAAPDADARRQLRAIAETYATLAKSATLLDESKDIVRRIDQFRKK